jgi:hypothetical protein
MPSGMAPTEDMWLIGKAQSAKRKMQNAKASGEMVHGDRNGMEGPSGPTAIVQSTMSR